MNDTCIRWESGSPLESHLKGGKKVIQNKTDQIKRRDRITNFALAEAVMRKSSLRMVALLLSFF